MDIAIQVLGYGGVLPASVSIAVVYLARRLMPQSAGDRYAAPLALGVAFFVGYLLLPSWAALIPQRHWHWLPYFALVAMIVGPVALAPCLVTLERLCLQLLLALIAAWFLVPDWPDLRPPRPVYIAILVSYFFLFIALLDSLPSRLRGSFFLALLMLVALAVALLVGISVSLMFGHVAVIVAAALLGCFASTFFVRKEAFARGLIPGFAILIGGLAFVGCIEPERPLVGILIAAAAPLALWSCAWGPLARLEGLLAKVAQTIAVLVPLIVAVVWVTVS